MPQKNYIHLSHDCEDESTTEMVLFLLFNIVKSVIKNTSQLPET